MGIEVGDQSIRLLKMRIRAEVLRRGVLIDKEKMRKGDELILPDSPSIETVLTLFKQHDWTKSLEFTELETWAPCREAQNTLQEMPCAQACKRSDVMSCYRDSFPIHLTRTGKSFKAAWLTEQDRAEIQATVEHGYEE